MSRSYAPTELKRRLRPALEELEQLGFLEPLDAEERYSWVSRGNWRIILIRHREETPDAPPPPSEAAELAEALAARGITPKTAADLVAAHPPGRVRTKIEVFDWLVKNEDKRVGKNPAGYLVASIRSDYQPPDDFAAAPAKVKADEARARADEARQTARRKTRDEKSEAEAREAELRARWDLLPEAEREAIRLSVKAANPGLGRWKHMLEPLCLAAMDAPRPAVAVQKGLFS
jgi:hypothetical protein